MKKETIKSLKRKGWSEEDIQKAEKIIEARRVSDKSRSIAYSHRVLYWTVILVVIIGNFVISMLLVPFLLVLNKLALDVLVVVLGLAFGSLFNLLITDIAYISKRHHVIAGITIPVMALLNISVMVHMANAINEVLRISAMRGDPITISIIYVIAFMAPYLWTVLVKKRISF